MRQAAAKGTGLLVGMIIGAGMFALPYTVLRSGVFWALFHFIFAAFLATSVHVLYGYVLYHNHERHRLPGYTKEYMGRGWACIAFASRFFSYYGYLLAYGVLAGIFLQELVPVMPAEFFGASFFILMAPFLLMNLRGASTVNLYLTIPLIAFVIVLFVALAPVFEFEDVALFPENGDWLLPYGIFLFAFSGASAIPEVVDLVYRQDRRVFKRIAVSATMIAAVVYALFIISIIGVAGDEVGAHALSTLEEFAPRPLFLIGVLIGLLAVSTSYLALGLELRFTFQYDLAVHTFAAWFFTASLPLLLYLWGIMDFVLILSVIGAIGVGFEGIVIALLARRLTHTPRVYVYALVMLFAVGAILECFRVLGVI